MVRVFYLLVILLDKTACF